jgi:hypothetical protein
MFSGRRSHQFSIRLPSSAPHLIGPRPRSLDPGRVPVRFENGRPRAAFARPMTGARSAGPDRTWRALARGRTPARTGCADPRRPRPTAIYARAWRHPGCGQTRTRCAPSSFAPERLALSCTYARTHARTRTRTHARTIRIEFKRLFVRYFSNDIGLDWKEKNKSVHGDTVSHSERFFFVSR